MRASASKVNPNPVQPTPTPVFSLQPSKRGHRSPDFPFPPLATSRARSSGVVSSVTDINWWLLPIIRLTTLRLLTHQEQSRGRQCPRWSSATKEVIPIPTPAPFRPVLSSSHGAKTILKQYLAAARRERFALSKNSSRKKIKKGNEVYWH